MCVELDEVRYQSMQNPSAWESPTLVRAIRQKKVGFLAANLFLGFYQKRIAKKLDAPAGGEMIRGSFSCDCLAFLDGRIAADAA